MCVCSIDFVSTIFLSDIGTIRTVSHINIISTIDSFYYLVVANFRWYHKCLMGHLQFTVNPLFAT